LIHITDTERITISPRDVALVQQTWNSLVELKDKENFDVSVLGRFSELLLSRLMLTDSNFAALFGKTPLLEQRSMVKSLNVLVQSASMLETEATLENLRLLGMKHEIYNVDKFDYKFLGETTIQLMEEFLGSEVINATVKVAWENVIDAQRKIMHKRAPDYDVYSGSVMRPSRARAQKWKQCQLRINLKYLYIYADEKGVKIKTSHPLSDCREACEGTPLPDGTPTLQILTASAPSSFSFAVSQEELSNWINEFKWRIEAHKRARLIRTS
jgi:hemoglobin-like flavoprotein